MLKLVHVRSICWPTLRACVINGVVSVVTVECRLLNLVFSRISVLIEGLKFIFSCR